MFMSGTPGLSNAITPAMQDLWNCWKQSADADDNRIEKKIGNLFKETVSQFGCQDALILQQLADQIKARNPDSRIAARIEGLAAVLQTSQEPDRKGLAAFVLS